MTPTFAERFLGTDVDPWETDDLVANPEVETPLTMQVLFPGPLAFDADALRADLRAFAPELAGATAEEAPPGLFPERTVGMAGWGPHLIKLVGFDRPFDADLVETCLRPAHFREGFKAEGRAHRSHVLLFSCGREPDPFEQYAALAAVAAALAKRGATLVLNAAARAAFPAPALVPEDGDGMAFLRGLPVPMLYGGFVKLEVEGEPGVWVRTFGNHLLELPDLAYHAAGHGEGEFAFDLFSGVLDYLRETDRRFAAGDTVQAGEGVTFRLRGPAEAEWFLESAGELFVMERVGG